MIKARLGKEQFAMPEICFKCNHLGDSKITEEGTTACFCDAFPDGDGIPQMIWDGDKHQRPVPGDHGIQFELDERFLEAS